MTIASGFTIAPSPRPWGPGPPSGPPGTRLFCSPHPGPLCGPTVLPIRAARDIIINIYHCEVALATTIVLQFAEKRNLISSNGGLRFVFLPVGKMLATSSFQIDFLPNARPLNRDH